MNARGFSAGNRTNRILNQAILFDLIHKNNKFNFSHARWCASISKIFYFTCVCTDGELGGNIRRDG